MKTIRLAIYPLIILCCFRLAALAADFPVNPYDPKLEPSKSFHAARAHLEAGEYEKAFTIHEWMFDNIKSLRPEVFVLYVYNLTYDWHEVAKKYPPAMKALLERRDRSEEMVRAAVASKAGKESDDVIYQKIAFLETIGFNQWLGENKRSADLYDDILRQNPGFATPLYYFVRDALVKAKRFDLVAPHEPSPEAAVDSCISSYQNMLRIRPDLKRLAESRFIEGITTYINIFNGSGATEKAEKVRTLALQFLESPIIRDYGKKGAH